MKLQRATIEDIQALLEIEKTTIGVKTYSRWRDEKEMKERLDSEVVYLIENDGVTVGSISYEIKNENHADISALVVKPEFQRQGLAKQAMELLLEELKNFKKLTLEVHPDNHSVKLYESFGFVTESRQENYYDGEPRLIMIKNN
ncbi:MAG: GNAT family N-acetyltransferase [Parcubacteria group bacterium]